MCRSLQRKWQLKQEGRSKGEGPRLFSRGPGSYEAVALANGSPRSDEGAVS